MVSRDQVDSVLARIRPYLQGDGGDIELVDVSNDCARVRLIGNCVGCSSAHLTLYIGIEAALKEAIPDFKELLVL